MTTNKTKTDAPFAGIKLLATVQQVASQHTGDPPDVWGVERGEDGFRATRSLSGSYTLVELESICQQIRTVQERVTLVTGEQGDTQERREFVRLAPRVGVDPAWFGRTFRSNGSGAEYRVTGVKPGRSRYPVLCERVPDGKRFKFSAFSVADAIARQAAAALPSNVTKLVPR